MTQIVTARMADRETAHQKLIQDREEVKRKLEERVEQELETNRDLADRYRWAV